MFEIILILMLLASALLGAAKKRPRRRARTRWVVLRINTSLQLSTLADNTVLSVASTSFSSGQRIRWTHFEGFIAIDGLTVGQGPIVAGVAHSDYSVTEIKEAIEADVSTLDDKVNQEKARRLVRDWGIFVGAQPQEWLNNEATRQKFRVALTQGEGQAPNFWAYNDSGAALTTGSAVTWNGKLYGIVL